MNELKDFTLEAAITELIDKHGLAGVLNAAQRVCLEKSFSKINRNKWACASQLIQSAIDRLPKF